MIGFVRLGLDGVQAAKLGYAIRADQWRKGAGMTTVIGPRANALLSVCRRVIRFRSTLGDMSTITFRAGPDVDHALDELTADTNEDRSAAIRRAILEAWRAHRAQRLREEAAALAADPDDRAEIRAIRDEMDSLRAW